MDDVDRIVAAWAEEVPDLDVSPLNVLSRVTRLARHLDFTRRDAFATHGLDGWEFDVFAGQNEGLIVAECERLAPVVDLKIPEFCVTEVTEDLRFTNDYLSKEPWRQWRGMYDLELRARGPHFLDLRGPETSSVDDGGLSSP